MIISEQVGWMEVINVAVGRAPIRMLEKIFQGVVVSNLRAAETFVHFVDGRKSKKNINLTFIFIYVFSGRGVAICYRRLG